VPDRLAVPREVLALEVRRVGMKALFVDQGNIDGQISSGLKRGFHQGAIPLGVAISLISAASETGHS
jgi:hypothetical protein